MDTHILDTITSTFVNAIQAGAGTLATFWSRNVWQMIWRKTAFGSRCCMILVKSR